MAVWCNQKGKLVQSCLAARYRQERRNGGWSRGPRLKNVEHCVFVVARRKSFVAPALRWDKTVWFLQSRLQKLHFLKWRRLSNTSNDEAHWKRTNLYCVWCKIWAPFIVSSELPWGFSFKTQQWTTCWRESLPWDTGAIDPCNRRLVGD